MVVRGLTGCIQAQVELTLQQGLDRRASNLPDQLIHSDLPAMSPEIPATNNAHLLSPISAVCGHLRKCAHQLSQKQLSKLW